MSMRTDQLTTEWTARISEAAAVFERRWTILALQRVDADLADRLREQRSIFNEATMFGKPSDIIEHGGAMCRGWQAAVALMDRLDVQDDAYMLGACPQTGVKVAVGHQKAAVGRVREVHGQDVVWITPDEVATLIATAEAFQRVAGIKKAFPGAEVVRYAAEGS